MTVRLGYTVGFLWTTIAISFFVHTCLLAKKTEACSKILVINELEKPNNISKCSSSGICNCTSAFDNLCIYNLLPNGSHTTGRGLCGKYDQWFQVMKYNEMYNIILNESSLEDVYTSPNISLWILGNCTHKPSCAKNRTTGSSDSCKKTEINLSVCGKNSKYEEKVCNEMKITNGSFLLRVNMIHKSQSLCWTCTNPVILPQVTLNLTEGTDGLVDTDGKVNPSKANVVMESIKSLVEKMGNNSSASIASGVIKGAILQFKDKKPFSFAYSTEIEGMVVVSNPGALPKEFPWSVDIPREAVNRSLPKTGGGGFAGIMRFPNMSSDAKNSSVFNDVVYGISMSANISNLKDPIIIKFNNVHQDLNLSTFKTQCSSWNGVGSQPIWTEDGCLTHTKDGNIQCNCSHLTFFAILMSPQSNGTVTKADLDSLTYISYIGCGLSMFFLGVALFMHYLLRKAKSSQSIQILMNLFTALFLLNLTFLSNEWVAGTGSFLGCIIIATVMHYSMLTTFTWFALQALHLYLRLIKMSSTKSNKHYMLMMCIPAWVCPAVVVITLAAMGKYHEIVIATAQYQAKMCWLTDTTVHYVVNIGYYVAVFVFTLGIFVVVVQRILMARKLKVKDARTPSTSKNLMAIMSLLALLGLTWGVAFFSYGPMLVPSYYIFCILNAFQGFFLFIYYYKNSKELNEDFNAENPFKSSTSSSASSAISNTYVTHG